MNYAFTVRGFESAADLQDYLGGFFWRQLSLFSQHPAQVLPLQIFHGDEFETVGLAQIEYADDVAMRHLPSQDQLLLEAFQDFRVGGQFGANNFQRDQTIQFLVTGLINRTHAALPQKCQDFVPIAENRTRRKFPRRQRRGRCPRARDRPAFRRPGRPRRCSCSRRHRRIQAPGRCRLFLRFVLANERHFRSRRSFSAFPTCSGVGWIFRFAVRTSHVQSCVLSALPADLVKTRRFQHFRQHFRFLCSVILVYSRLLCCGFDANAHFRPF